MWYSETVSVDDVYLRQNAVRYSIKIGVPLGKPRTQAIIEQADEIFSYLKYGNTWDDLCDDMKAEEDASAEGM